MSSIFGSLLGGGSGAGIGSLIAPLAAVAQPGPSQASRGYDYNPVTSINNVGGADYAGLSSLINSINAGNSANGGLSTTGILANTFAAEAGTGYNPLIIIALLGLVGIILWRKFGK
jgi:hypothetical protein